MKSNKIRKSSTIGLLFVGLVLIVILSSTIISNLPGTDENTDELTTLNAPLLSSDFTQMNISAVQRDFTFHENGLVYITDAITITNEQGSSINSMHVLIPSVLKNSLIFYQAYDQGNVALSTSKWNELDDGHAVLEIAFNYPVGSYQEETITLKTVYKDAFNYTSAYNRYDINIDLVPLTNYFIDSYTTNVILPSGVNSPTFIPVGTDEGNNVYQFTGTSVSNKDTVQTHLEFVNSASGYLKFSKINRMISVYPHGLIKVEEEQTLKSYSNTQTSQIKFSVPGGIVGNVTARDDLGEIIGLSQNEFENIDGQKNVTFTLTANRFALGFESQITYTIEYTLDSENYFSQDIGKFNVNLDLITTKTEILVEEETTTVILKGCTSISSYSANIQESEIVKNSQGISITKTYFDVTAQHSGQIDITFKANSLLLFGRAFILSTLFLIVIGAYVVYRSKNPRDDQALQSDDRIPVSELNEFIKLYEEKNALSVDKDDLDEELLRRKIKKKIYNSRVKNIEKQIKELADEILPFKQLLIKSDSRISDLIQKLDFIEAEIISVRDSITLLDNRYKLGKLPSKGAYEKLSRELLIKLSKSQKKIDRYINDLRSYVI